MLLCQSEFGFQVFQKVPNNAQPGLFGVPSTSSMAGPFCILLWFHHGFSGHRMLSER